MQDSINKPSRSRRLNVRSLCIVIGCTVGLWATMHWIHGHQVVKTGMLLKAGAEEALEQKDHDKAFELFEQYLSLNPDDTEVLESMSDLLDEHGGSDAATLRAMRINDILLRKDRDRHDLRLRQVRLAEKLGRFADAATHLKTLREQQSDDSDVWYYSGVLAAESGDLEAAAEFFEQAVSLPNPRPEGFGALAGIVGEQNKNPADALDLLNRMVETNDGVVARRIRAEWFLKQEKTVDAVNDLWVGLEFVPDDLETCSVLLNTIRDAQSGDSSLDSASVSRRFIEHVSGVLQDKPELNRLRSFLASAMWADGMKQDAILTLEKGIQLNPRSFNLREILVDYLVSTEQTSRAREEFEQIPKDTISAGRHRFLEGRLQMAEKKWNEALQTMESALGYAHHDSSLTARVRVCLALCRRELGDDAGAVESYRTLVQSSPKFEGGRLGMASAYLRSNQKALAIAEYRQLTHVDGVPAFLANLLIREELTRSPGNRNWKEVEALLSEENPIVKDDVQRVLLQVDLLFARGLPARAIDKLNAAVRRMPDREEIQRAYRRVSSVHGDGLRDRIQQLLDENPRNEEAHVAMLRVLVAGDDRAGITLWLDRLIAREGYAELSPATVLNLVAESARRVAESEVVTRGENEATQLLLQYADNAYQQLVRVSNTHLLSYVDFVSTHKSVDTALQLVSDAKASNSANRIGDCFLTCLRSASERSDVQLRVNNEIVSMIRANPGSIALRTKYADAKILLKQYREAEQALRQIADYDKRNSEAKTRLALLELLVNNRPAKALELSSSAITDSGANAKIRTRNIHAAVLAGNGRADEALGMIRAIPEADRTTASRVFEAYALAALGHSRAAATLILELEATSATSNLLPPEKEMLTNLQQEVDARPAILTSVE